MSLRIWKCDTKWGDKSILDLVVDLRIAFFGTDVSRIGHYEQVNPGDIIGIAQGTQIVALAEALSKFAPLEDVGKEILPREVVHEFVEDSGVAPQGCRISSVYWLKKSIVNDRRGGRFFELKPWADDYKRIHSAWQQYKENPSEQKFNIAAGTKTLLGEDDRDSLICESSRYVIPVYQRAYAWGEAEISRLLEDIAEGSVAGDPRFIGSVQVSAPRKLAGGIVSYELIDGQQRLSTLLILLRHLGFDYTGKLRTVVNAGSAQKDWDDFRESFGTKQTAKFPLNKYVQASQMIGVWLKGQEEEFGIDVRIRLRDYIIKQLLFVVIQTTAGISKTIQIFNVINTSGMDLNAADIFKIRFYEYLTRKSGPDECLFSRVSRCYQRIADYNRDSGWNAIPMVEAISFYQKAIVSKFSLSTELFGMAAQRFFEQLFDYLLDGKKWPGFVDKGIELTIDGFERAIDVIISVHAKSVSDNKFRLFKGMLGETRYGGVASQYPALACYFRILDVNDVDAITDFSEKLFKKLVPPSMYYSKVVNDVRSTKLHALLIALSRGEDAVKEILDRRWIVKGVNEDVMLEKGLNQDLVYSPKWKNLACKIVEMLLSKDKSDKTVADLLFDTDFDIEHIQSYVDESDREEIWKVWKWELNGLGNLAMLEPDLNRSIQNESSKKGDAYQRSRFSAVKFVMRQMNDGKWTKDQAKTRREELSKIIAAYILNDESH